MSSIEVTNKGTQWANECFRFIDWLKMFIKDVFSALWVLAGEAGRGAIDRGKALKFKFSSVDFICGGISLVLLGVAGLVFMAGVGIVLYQAGAWMWSGAWNELPLSLVFNFLFQGTGLQSWLDAPTAWLGLHQIVTWVLSNVPVSLVLMASGGLAMGLMVGIITAALSIRLYQFNRTENK
jgi:hypothetical protein